MEEGFRKSVRIHESTAKKFLLLLESSSPLPLALHERKYRASKLTRARARRRRVVVAWRAT